MSTDAQQSAEPIGPMSPAQFAAQRTELLNRPGRPSKATRRALSALTDDWLASLFEQAGAGHGFSLIAVGGYGRGELSPGSDIDLLMLHSGDIGDVAERIWYPVWDAKLPLDHAVRTVPQARRMAAEDLKVVLGLLDSRTVVGDESLRQQLMSSVLSDWRGLAKKRMPDLHSLVQERRKRDGELAYLLEPDLKEAYGGLRDVTVLRAIAASWVTDISHGQIDSHFDFLLDVRDALHRTQLAAGRRRASNNLLMQEQDHVAELLGFDDGRNLMREVASSGRAIGFVSDTAWHAVSRITAKRVPGRFRRLVPGGRQANPERVPLAEGVVLQSGEAVLAAEARPQRDPILALRAGAAAAQAGVRLSLHAASRLAAESAPMPVPWPAEARDALTRLLGAGPAALPVWESLDQVGLVERLIPHWSAVRSAPQRNPVHRFTVDRHQIQTVVEAAKYQRDVDRPDLLLVAALLHDIGKGRPEIDHSILGAELMMEIAPQLGFNEADSATLVRLVRYHLLLSESATRRDPDDPATVAALVDAVGDLRTLGLLDALTRSDAAATGPKAWNEWKAALVEHLVRAARASMVGEPIPDPPSLRDRFPDSAMDAGVFMEMKQTQFGVQVQVGCADRRGLLALIAGVMAMHRLDVRDARTETIGDRVLSLWSVTPAFGDPPTLEQLRTEFRRALDGSVDVDAALSRREDSYPASSVAPPTVAVLVAEASQTASVLEVRAHDRPGTLYRLASAISGQGVDIRSASVESRGANVVDTFYLCQNDAPLAVGATENLLPAVRAALG